MLFLLTHTAFALDCASPDVDADTCNAVLDLVDDINAAYGDTVVSDVAPARRTPDALYAQLEKSRTKLQNLGCSPEFTHVVGGAYNAGAGTLSGGSTDGIVAAGLAGSVGAGRTFDMNFDGVTTGSLWSNYDKNGNAMADSDSDAILSARWIRVRGSRGVWIGMQTSCDLGVRTSVAQSFGVVFESADVTSPGDTIVPVALDGDNASPGNETVENAINDVGQKYLNFGRENTGFAVETGESLVFGLRLYPANDFEERDPASYVLEGSNTSIDGPWTAIADGPLALPSTRNPGGATALGVNQELAFENDVSYSFYRLYFPTVKGNGNSMQISEVELLGL